MLADPVSPDFRDLRVVGSGPCGFVPCGQALGRKPQNMLASL